MSLPRSIGPYQVVRLVGQGGMGRVYEVTDPAMPGRRLALELTLVADASPEALRRFQREVELLGRVEHPNVVRVWTAGARRLAGYGQVVGPGERD